MFDAQLVLRDLDADAVTSTAAATGKAFPATMAGLFSAVFHVTRIDTTSDETYLLSVEVDSTPDFDDDPQEIAVLSVVETGVYELPLSSALIKKLDPDAAAIRCKATLGGTSPSITYGAYLSPSAS